MWRASLLPKLKICCSWSTAGFKHNQRLSTITTREWMKHKTVTSVKSVVSILQKICNCSNDKGAPKSIFIPETTAAKQFVANLYENQPNFPIKHEQTYFKTTELAWTILVTMTMWKKPYKRQIFFFLIGGKDKILFSTLFPLKNFIVKFPQLSWTD